MTFSHYDPQFQQWTCCNIRPQVEDNTFKFELLFKRTSQPKITLTSTDIILHILFQSPVLFKSPPFLLINYTLTSTNIILHFIFLIGGGSSLPLPLYLTLTFNPFRFCSPSVSRYVLPSALEPPSDLEP